MNLGARLDEGIEKRRWGWKLLAGILTIGWIIYFFLYNNPDPYQPLQISQNVVNIIGVVGIWCFAFRLKFMESIVWQLLFIVDLLFFILRSCFSYTTHNHNPLAVIFLLLILVLPYYIGLFLYAFKSPEIWSNDEDSETKEP